jgi:hypothetical protein
VQHSHEAGNGVVKPTPHDDFLDGLRGLAILLVVVAHSPGLFVFLPNVGRAGVYLFFVLSAFLLSRQLYSFVSVTITTSTSNIAHNDGGLPGASSTGSVIDVNLSA